MSKSDFRNRFKTVMQDLFANTESVSDAQKKLTQNLTKFMTQQSGIWAAYWPLPQEASVKEAVEASEHIRWVYPRMQNGKLDFCLPELWEKVQFGVTQPAQGAQVIDLKQIQGVLVPGLAFDRQGNRLGRGKGFYDQTLETFSGIKVGIAYKAQMSSTEVPNESHDVKMDFIITDEGIFQRGVGWN